MPGLPSGIWKYPDEFHLEYEVRLIEPTATWLFAQTLHPAQPLMVLTISAHTRLSLFRPCKLNASRRLLLSGRLPHDGRWGKTTRMAALAPGTDQRNVEDTACDNFFPGD